MIPPWFPQDLYEELKSYNNFFKIAEGGFGEIYHADYHQGKKILPVIVKRLKPTYASNPTKRQCFENEAHHLKKVRHRSIPGLFGAYRSSNEFFFIMEEAKGCALSTLIHHAKIAKQDLSRPLAFWLLLEACSVLKYLHEFKMPSGRRNPIVHGDIKPSNFILTNEPKIFLIDFSMANHYQEQKKLLGGTYPFMAPENLAGYPATPQTEIFSLMLTFFNTIHLKKLIDNVKEKDLFFYYASQQYLDIIKKEKFPKPIETLFLRGLALNPKDRYQSVENLKRATRRCIKKLGIKIDLGAIKKEIQKLSKIS